MTLRCIIVDDESFARSGLAEDIQTIDFMQVTGTTESALQAMELLAKQDSDLVFLDIEMPKLNGFDRVDGLETGQLFIGPHCIPVSRNFKEAIAGRIAEKKLAGASDHSCVNMPYFSSFIGVLVCLII